MGSTCTATCNCGFTEEVTIGGGKARFHTHSYFPHYCETCGLVEVNIHGDKIECPKCGSISIVAYGDERLSKRTELAYLIQWYDYKMPSEMNLCPKCKKYSLQFMPGIHFD